MTWATQELSRLDVKDARRKARLIQMVERMAQRPSGSIPQTFENHAQAKAAYRALSSEAIEPEAVRSAMQDACVGRMADHQVVLAIQDTSCFNFTRHPATAGTGPLARPDQSGFLVHSVLAASGDGVPLGLLHQRAWARDPEAVGQRHRRKQRPLQEKESFRWIETLRATHAAVPDQTTVITVADREADLFELFAEERPHHSELLIRGCRERRLEGSAQRLWETVRALPEGGRWHLTVRRRPDRAARDAQVVVRYGQVTLRPPTGGVHAPDLGPVTVTALLVTELDPPEGDRGIEWLLLTTLKVATEQQARRCVEFYTLRWLIERYHYVLKSGCRIEESQLRSVERIERLLALYCVVAWRLLWLTYTAREDGDQPCTVAFAELEWQTAYRLCHENQPLPPQPPTVSEVVRWIAGLGGFLARRGDGEPGVKVLWRGLMRLHDIILGFTLASPGLVGNA